MEGNSSGMTSLKYVVNKSFSMVAFESYVCLICDDLLTALPHKIGIQSCECGELKIEQTKNIHRVFGTFGKYYCTNPQKKKIVGDKIKVISGLFKGDEGIVTKLVPARERVKVLFEILGRPTEVEISEDEVDFPSAHPIGTG